MKFTQEEIYKYWSNEACITIEGTSYRVGKMSYGDYFLEPGVDRGELTDFNTGTLWLRKELENNQPVYVVDYEY